MPRVSSLCRLSFVFLVVLVAVAGFTPAFGQACPDADGDGFADCSVPGCDSSGLTCGDCDDSLGAVNPNGTETCNDLDDDCNGIVDDGATRITSGKRVLESDRANSDHFGWAVAGIRDVNGDGIADFVAGSPTAGDNGGSSGRVSLFDGATRTLICTGVDPLNSGSDQLGYAVAAVGDIDGDGTEDFAAAAPYEDQGFSNAGAIVVFSGADCSFVRRCEGQGTSYHLGFEKGLAGWVDITGDGVPEILAGSMYADPSSTADAGEAYVFNGATCAIEQTFVHPTPAAADYLGASLDGLGDVNGDGTPDVIVGAYQDDDVSANSGSALVFSGADGSVIDTLLDPSPANSDNFGFRVVNAGDVDGDGTSDVAVGSRYRAGTAGANDGQVIVFSGASGVLLHRASNPDGGASDYLGSDLSVLPDTNGDGIPELLAGAPSASPGGVSSAGSATLFNGADGAKIRTYEALFPNNSNNFGFAVAGAGDLSGDTAADVLIGTRYDDDQKNRTNVGSVTIFASESDCDADGVTAFGGDCDDNEAASLPGAAEICDALDNDCDGAIDEDEDGDGFDVCSDVDDTNPTIFPGAPERCNGLDDDGDGSIDEGDDLDGDGFETPCDCDDSAFGVNPGVTEICNNQDDNCGGVDEGFASELPGISVEDPDRSASDQFGWSVAALSDVTGDGVADFVAAGTGDDVSGSNVGSVMLFSGADRSPLCRAESSLAGGGESVGYELAAIGDVDGDGTEDFAAAAPYADDVASNSGAILLFSGADCSEIRRCSDPSAAANIYLGFENGLGMVPDITGDGVNEIVASTLYADLNGITDSGYAVVFDGADCSVIHTLLAPDQKASDHFGISAAGIADVTGDGTADVLVGANQDDAEGVSNSGSVYLFSGSDGSFVRRMLDPELAGSDELGWSVTSTPDLNGDGFPDIAAGARYRAGAAGSNVGQVLVFDGRSGNFLYRAEDPSGGASAYLGYSVSAVDDLDGDGVADILAGAPYDDNAVGDGGRVVAFSGADGSFILGWTNPDPSGSDHFGWDVAGIADITGDGRPDAIAGERYADDPKYGNNTGLAWVLASESDCDADGVSELGGDCDDEDGASFLGAPEICDGLDNDCDGATDEDDDGDGFDICSDIDDNDPTIYPGAPERCNGVDDDGDGSIDEGFDLDGDGVELPCDCDDDDFDRNPGATEVCNHLDDNCGATDEGFAQTLATALVVDPVGLTANDSFAFALDEVEDVTGDGIPDIVVGSRYDEEIGGISNQGAALIFSGADRSLVCRGWDPDASSSAYLGQSVTGLGDVNGDLVPDFAAGAPYQDTTGLSDPGAIVIFSGADCSVIRRCFGTTSQQYMGWEGVDAVPDLTGDGIDEIVAGSPYADSQGLGDSGRVIVYDPTDCSVVHEVDDPRARPSDWLGNSVIGLPDVTGDGTPDFAAGEHLDDSGASNGGSVLVFSGADGSLHLRLVDEDQGSSSDHLGWHIARGGDIDGDGWEDIIAGARYASTTGGSNAGGAVVFSARDGRVIRRYEDPDGGSNDYLGWRVDSIGDLDGDGVNDIAAGAPGADPGGVNDGGRIVVFSGADASVIAAYDNAEGSSSDQLGLSLTGIGDLTGDDAVDIIAGSGEFDRVKLGTSFGAFVVLSQESDCDGDGFGPFGGDCDDTSSAVFAGNPEICDTLDNDCDGDVDEDDDFDGFGICSDSNQANRNVYPGAPELCNGIDDDLDGSIDEGEDLDGDGYETPCDCADDSFDRNPDAIEVCNHLDDNCGGVDEGFTSVIQSRRIIDPSPTSSDNFGHALAGLDDLDGDGVPEILVGNLYDDTYNSNYGSAVVYSGADLSLYCKAFDPGLDAGEYLGQAVMSIGDVNGDGTPDFGAGTPYFDEGVNDTGAVTLFSGADCSVIRRCSPPDAGAYVGWDTSLADISDANGDGVPDIVAGATYADLPSAGDAGVVYLFSGADCALLATASDPIRKGSDRLGQSVVGLDDVDGDGTPDFAAGSFGDDSAANDAGAVLVFSGADGSLIRRVVDPEGGSSDQLGYDLDSGADFDGDGFLDLVVGSRYRAATGGASAGQVLIFSGFDGSLILRMEDPGGGANDYLGQSVAVVDDADGDNVADILAGAPGADGGANDAGLLVLFSGADGSKIAEFSKANPVASDQLGFAVDSVGDLDGDGAPEFLGGVRFDDLERGVSNGGSVYVFGLQSDCDGDGVTPFGGDCDDAEPASYEGKLEICDSIDNDCDGLVDEDDDGDGVGICADFDDDDPLRYPGAPELCNGIDDDGDGSIDEGSDADGDGFTTPCDCEDDNFDVNPGVAEVCNQADDNCGAVDEGFASVPSSSAIQDPDAASSDSFGRSIDQIDDVNGDGVVDLVVGVELDDVVAGNSGSVLLISGSDRGPICRASDDLGASSDFLGTSVAALGDIDGDGTADFAAAAPRADAGGLSNSGAVVIFSGADCSDIRRCELPDGEVGDELGRERGLAAIEDVTGDGVPDLIAMSQYRDDAGTSSGGGVVFSGADCSIAYRLVDPFGQSNDYYGTSVAAIDDLTGDGVQDIVVGSPLEDSVATNAGLVLLHSGADGSLVRVFSDPEGAGSDELGWDVAATPDMNGDGWSDVLAGIRYDDELVSNSGSALLFSGRDGAVIRRFTDPDGVANDYLGSAVSVSADVDGDGTAEVLAGAPHFDEGAINAAGKVLLFSGADGSVLATFKNPDPGSSDLFGDYVLGLDDVSGDTAPDFATACHNCDSPGVTDNAGVVVLSTLESDCDGDGFGLLGGDCDDTQASIYPGAPEVCDDLDNDCNGQVDENLEQAVETCNGLDDNCNGLVDEGNPEGGGDCDSGEPGVCADGVFECIAGSLTCSPERGPGPELCDLIDNDCDGSVDEPEDIDGDGVDNCDDNCEESFNTDQANGDGDAFGDVCDCDPVDPDNLPPVGLGDTLEVSYVDDDSDGTRETIVSWLDGGVPGPFRLYRGWKRPSNAFVYNHVCVGPAVSGNSAEDPLMARRATMFYYLVSREECGESTLGDDSFGNPRPNDDPCPSVGTDADGDGFEEAADTCPGYFNPSQTDLDMDGDGDPCDNCPEDPNPDQSDIDGDGLGDVCDPDRDGDGFANGADNCPDVFNPGQEDTDNDGIGDACDPN